MNVCVCVCVFGVGVEAVSCIVLTLAVQRGDGTNLSWSQEELLDWFCQDKEFFFESTEVCVHVCMYIHQCLSSHCF